MNEAFEKDRFDALMSLADYGWKRAESRRQLGWRISFALWALLVAITCYTERRPPEWMLLAALAFTVFLHLCFCFAERIRTRTDVEKSFWYVDHAEAMLWPPPAPLGAEPPQIDALSWLQRWRDWRKDVWSTGTQIWVTSLLAGLAYFALGLGYV